MIEQPKRQTGPRDAQWFYAICTCGKLVEVTEGIIPSHSYTVHGMFGMASFLYPCDRSLTRHGT